MFKLIVNGDIDHALTRSFGWQGEALEYKRVLQANEFVTTIDCEDKLRGNDRRGVAMITTRRVYTRPEPDAAAETFEVRRARKFLATYPGDASLAHVRPADRKRAASW
jgi:hypothetical protein